MLCDNCHKRVATVHLTQIINNSKNEVHLCDSCAKENNFMNYALAPEMTSFFNSILGFTGQPYVSTPKAKTCDVCGMTFEDFKNTGRLGCTNCYKVFSDRIDPVIKRIHGNVSHSGRVPKEYTSAAKTEKVQINEVDILKKKLDELIKLEKFEEAAVIRDKIKVLEGRGKE